MQAEFCSQGFVGCLLRDPFAPVVKKINTTHHGGHRDHRGKRGTSGDIVGQQS
jgi:hypothetical protein